MVLTKEVSILYVEMSYLNLKFLGFVFGKCFIGNLSKLLVFCPQSFFLNQSHIFV
jgi:hypothetical protein